MKKKNGFTLIELLAVIVILGVIVTLAVPSVGFISNKVKENMYESKIKLILSAAKLYGEDNKSSLTCYSSEDCSIIVTVQDLLDEGYLTKDKDNEEGKPIITDPRDNSSLNDYKVTLYLKNNRVYAEGSITSIFKNPLNSGSYIAYDLSSLTVGKKYRISSNKPLTRVVISYDNNGTRFVKAELDYKDVNGFNSYEFTMPSNTKSSNTTPYMYLAKEASVIIKDLSYLDGYEISIEEVK